MEKNIKYKRKNNGHYYDCKCSFCLKNWQKNIKNHKDNCKCVQCKPRFNKNNHQWKGNNAGYGAIHNWIKRNLGKPMVCYSCGNKNSKQYHWANISGEYKRDLDDYIRLCIKCHKIFDHKNIPKGEFHYKSRLTKKDILDIRSSYKFRKVTSIMLGKRFNVTPRNIRNIIQRRTWKHI